MKLNVSEGSAVAEAVTVGPTVRPAPIKSADPDPEEAEEEAGYEVLDAKSRLQATPSTVRNGYARRITREFS